MQNSDNNQIIENLINAYINESNSVNSNFSPEFIYNSNDKENPKKVFYSIRENLLNCEEFYFSIAFITDSGLSLLKEILKEIENKNPTTKGKIVTSNYLGFTEPKAIKELQQFKNIEIKLFYINPSNNVGFHTKGYIFKFKNDEYKAIIGSSNLTQSALTTNNEWNNLIVGNKNGKIIRNILDEFDRIWNLSTPIKDIIDKYENEYNTALKVRKSINKAQNEYEIFKPNAMQMVFINRLNDSINNNDTRGLLISSTGTGKTYASAFGIKYINKFKVNRLLYITHRENILKQAMKSYKKVFGDSISMSLYTGNNHDINDSRFIFSTISLLGKKEYFNKFDKDYFDVIVIDECHRIGEKTLYQNIINYFKPKYLLGMSATPDRLDGYDIYKVFNNNILYEIRLYDALEANMLVPFHYFGVSDLFIDNVSIDDKTEFKYLTCDERVNKIIENSKYFGYSGPRLKCLLFVSNKEEGKELANKINSKNIKCLFLSGEDSIEKRNKAISLLEENDIFNKDYLEIIITCDIFNEGIDIPSINQVIFLRPTLSSIIFIQQLGRGLRLDIDKEYLTVIDFIGNYQSNFLIPETFASKNSGQKHNEKDLYPVLPGSSVIQFDEISTKRIIEALAKVNNTEKRRIKEQYINIKHRLGKIPTIIEFDKLGKLSGRSFLDFYQNGFISYYDFLYKMSDENVILDKESCDTITYLSRNIGSGLRIYDALLLKTLILGNSELDFINILNNLNKNRKVPYIYNEVVQNSVESVLNTSFGINNSSKINPISICIKENNHLKLTDEFIELLKNNTFKKYILEIINYSLYSHHRYFSNFDNSLNNFVLFEKYSRKDVCLLINNLKNEESTIYGYKVFKQLKIVPIFVTYHKDLDDDSSINYKDCFINPSIFMWDSRNKRTLDSEEIISLIDLIKNDGRVLLFVKRDSVIDKNGLSKDKDNSFYYLGEVGLNGEPFENENGTNFKVKVVRFPFKLKNSVKSELYNYLISKPLIVD